MEPRTLHRRALADLRATVARVPGDPLEAEVEVGAETTPTDRLMARTGRHRP